MAAKFKSSVAAASVPHAHAWGQCQSDQSERGSATQIKPARAWGISQGYVG